MKLTNVKAMFAKVATVGLVAGAIALAVPAKAEAQVVGIGVGLSAFWLLLWTGLLRPAAHGRGATACGVGACP